MAEPNVTRRCGEDGGGVEKFRKCGRMKNVKHAM
jgi:hypothetical protein